MERKLPPSHTTGKTLHALLSGEVDTDDLLRELMRRGSEHILQTSLEEEVTDFLGQDHYSRGERRGYRNGYQDQTIKSGEGLLHVRRPRVRDTDEPFESRILRRISRLEKHVRRLAPPTIGG